MRTVLRLWTLLGVLLILASLGLWNYATLCRARGEIGSEPRGKRIAFFADPQIEGHDRVKHEGWYGALNNVFNDVYEKFVFGQMVKAFEPEIVFVLGDLFSKQNLPDEEFFVRLERYSWIFESPLPRINITGNHDIGYGDDVLFKGLRRFEEHLGHTNGEFLFSGHHIIYFNSQLLDPSREKELSEEVFGFISNAAELRHIFREKKYLLQQDPPVEAPLDQLREHLNYTAHNSQGALRYSRQWTEEELEQLAQSPVILIDHMPLNKPFGTCVDEPTIRLTSDGFVRDQTMISENISNQLIENLQPVLIFNGHDHHGCFYRHRQDFATEHTIRSVMGDFGGNSAVLEIRENENGTGFDYVVENCPFISTNQLVIFLVVLGSWAGVFALLFLFSLYIKSRSSHKKND